MSNSSYLRNVSDRQRPHPFRCVSLTISGKFPAEDISPDLKQWPVIFIPLWGGNMRFKILFTFFTVIHLPDCHRNKGRFGSYMFIFACKLIYFFSASTGQKSFCGTGNMYIFSPCLFPVFGLLIQMVQTLFLSSYATCLFNNVVVLSNLLCFLPSIPLTGNCHRKL